MRSLIAVIGAAIMLGGAADAPPPLPDRWFSGAPGLTRRLEGKRATEVMLEEWINGPKSTQDLRGRIVVVNFWAEWCPPSVDCLRKDADLHRRYAGKGVEVMAIHDGSPRGRRNWPFARRRCEDLGVTFPHGLDFASAEKSVAASYLINSFPTYVIIDRLGVIRASAVRPEYVEEIVKRLLEESWEPEEFPPFLYHGGERRLSSLKAMEARAAPPFQGAEWIGDPVRVGKGGIVVAHFFSPTFELSREALKELRKLRDELAARGATLVAITDATGDWSKVQQLARDESWNIPVMLDRCHDPGSRGMPGGAGDADHSGAGMAESTASEISSRGVTVNAYAASSMGPTNATVVIDGRGVLRASGLRPESVVEVVEHVAMNPEPRPYEPAKKKPETSAASGSASLRDARDGSQDP